MATVLTKDLLKETIETIQQLYKEDNIPWICGYSGGKDSSAVVQLVWMALSELPEWERSKPVHVISTDTLVESPVVALWASQSLEKMRKMATSEKLPIIPHRLTPQDGVPLSTTRGHSLSEEAPRYIAKRSLFECPQGFACCIKNCHTIESSQFSIGVNTYVLG